MELVYSGSIVGVTFEPAKSNIIRAVAAYRSVKPHVVLEHDPANPYDSEAIRVLFRGAGPDIFVGHIPKPHNSKILALGLNTLNASFERWNEVKGQIAGATIEVTKRV